MSNHLGQIYATTKDAEKYIVLNSQVVELSGNVKLTNGNLEVSNNLIFNNFSVSDKIYFKENSGSTSYNIINNSLISNNDASFNNVDIVGELNITGTITADTSITLDSTTITTAELGVLDNVTPGTAEASKALVLDTDGNVSGLGTVGCGSIVCSSVSQSSPYYLNLGYNVTSGVVTLARSVSHLTQLTYNTSRWTSTPTSDFSTTGVDGYWWCPSQTGIYLVCCRAQVRASNQDMVVEVALSLVKKNTSNASGYDVVANTNERNWESSATSRQDDRDFSKAPSLTTIVRVMSTSEKYRMRVYVATGSGTVAPWLLKSMNETGMEVTKLA